MKLAILFWFYKEPEICQNRLQILRRYNPATPIYGLYGGDPGTVDIYISALSIYLDDFYAFSESKDSYWKWMNGDLVITDWYRERGKYMEWDSILIIQWDMLVFEAVDKVFSMLQPGEILLSGLRPIAEVEKQWHWVSPLFPNQRQRYLEFLEYICKTYNYSMLPLGSLFIVVAFPKSFLDKYSKVEEPELGFLEYRIPIYAQIFGIPFCNNHPFEAWWIDLDQGFRFTNPVKRALYSLRLKFDPNPLNPAKREISLIPIYCHLISHKGARIFHPYGKIYPTRSWKWAEALIMELYDDLRSLLQKLLAKVKILYTTCG